MSNERGDHIVPSKTSNSISCMMENEHQKANEIERRLGNITINGDMKKDIISEGNTLIEIGKSRILCDHVEKVILNAIVFLKHSCEVEIPEDQTHHHPSVSEVPERVKVHNMQVSLATPFQNPTWGAFDFYQKSLSHMIDKKVRWSDDCLISILHKLADAVQHMHCRGMPHGNLAAQFVALSWDKRNHPFIRQPALDDSGAAATKSGDIKDLGKLFYLVLTNGTKYCGEVKSDDLLRTEEKTAKTSGELAEVAKNLIEKMVGEKPIEIDQVLQHPLFWEEEKKINFVTDLYDSISHNRDAIKDLETDASSFVFSGNWIEKLKVNSLEKEELSTSYDIRKPTLDMFRNKAGWSKTSSKKKVNVSVYMPVGGKLTELSEMKAGKLQQLVTKSKDENGTKCDDSVAEQLAREKFKGKQIFSYVMNGFVVTEKEKDGGYQEGSLYDLLRFLRNRKAHFWEDSPHERKYYKAAGGFWTFFSKRFPKLLGFLYDNREKFENFTG